MRPTTGERPPEGNTTRIEGLERFATPFEIPTKIELFQFQRYEDEFGGRGLAHARYGSLSDSLRRGELKYIPNGDVRESYYRNGDGRNMHKSYSTSTSSVL